MFSVFNKIVWFLKTGSLQKNPGSIRGVENCLQSLFKLLLPGVGVDNSLAIEESLLMEAVCSAQSYAIFIIMLVLLWNKVI